MKSKLRILFISLIFLGACAGLVIGGLIYSQTENYHPKKELVGTEIKWPEYKKEPLKPSEPPQDDQMMLVTTIILAS